MTKQQVFFDDLRRNDDLEITKEESIDDLLKLSGQTFIEIDAAKVDYDALIEQSKGMFDRIQAMQVKIEERILEFKKMIEDENKRQVG
jgi:hypothetical protein